MMKSLQVNGVMEVVCDKREEGPDVFSLPDLLLEVGAVLSVCLMCGKAYQFMKQHI